MYYIVLFSARLIGVKYLEIETMLCNILLFLVQG